MTRKGMYSILPGDGGQHWRDEALCIPSHLHLPANTAAESGPHLVLPALQSGWHGAKDASYVHFLGHLSDVQYMYSSIMRLSGFISPEIGFSKHH